MIHLLHLISANVDGGVSLPPFFLKSITSFLLTLSSRLFFNCMIVDFFPIDMNSHSCLKSKLYTRILSMLAITVLVCEHKGVRTQCWGALVLNSSLEEVWPPTAWRLFVKKSNWNWKWTVAQWTVEQKKQKGWQACGAYSSCWAVSVTQIFYESMLIHLK